MRAVIADDEPSARADLSRLLRALGVEIVGEARDGTEALRLVSSTRPDVLFLDIHMPGLDGLALLARGDLPPTVLVTAHEEHAHRAFDLDACDYVVKPASSERLSRALARARRRVTLEGDDAPRVRVTDARGDRFVDARRVEVFSALDKYVALVVDGEELLLRASLDELEARLVDHGFVRAHRAHLVRIAAAVRREDTEQGDVLVLASGRRVPVSKRMRAAVRRLL